MRSIRSGDKEHLKAYKVKQAKNHWQLPQSRKLVEGISNLCKTKTVYRLIQQCSCPTQDNYNSILRHLTLQMPHEIIFNLPTICVRCRTRLSVDTNNSFLTLIVLKACEARINNQIQTHSHPRVTTSASSNNQKLKSQQQTLIDNSKGSLNLYSYNRLLSEIA